MQDPVTSARFRVEQHLSNHDCDCELASLVKGMLSAVDEQRRIPKLGPEWGAAIEKNSVLYDVMFGKGKR